MKSTAQPEDPMRMSFVAMFRAAPPGGTIFVPQSAHWCTSIAAQSGRKITTRKALALHKRESTVSELTMVSFQGERPATQKKNTIDPRQFVIPGIAATA